MRARPVRYIRLGIRKRCIVCGGEYVIWPPSEGLYPYCSEPCRDHEHLGQEARERIERERRERQERRKRQRAAVARAERLRLRAAERFTAKVGPPDDNGCLPWTGAIKISTQGSGYGKFSVGGREVPAHRYAWEQVHGPIPEGYEMHHECRNRRCVNVEHLRLLTRGQHMRVHAKW